MSVLRLPALWAVRIAGRLLERDLVTGLLARSV